MNLISKKDLLAITGISYGQLYRWKRERLIPEEWFIKQSAYTGQETFFPREQVLSRVKSILELKDEYSLEELAKMFSPEESKSVISVQDIEEMNILDSELTGLLPAIYGTEEPDLWDVAFAAALCKIFKQFGLAQENTIGLLHKSARLASRHKTSEAVCTVFLAEEEYHAIFTAKTTPLVFDSSIEVVCQIPLSDAAEELKLKYKNKSFKKEN
ncbi:MAG: DUF4004 family protein [Eubacteriales bacterium]